MTIPQWLPRRGDAPGIALAAATGGLILFIAGNLPSALLKSGFVSEVLFAVVVGALVLNTPLRRIFGLALPSVDKEQDRYAAGLRFTGRWLLRLAVILLGLKMKTDYFKLEQVALVGTVLLVTLPSTFFFVHAIAAPLGLRRPLADLVAGGTMICGASAVNALAPVTGARREEQGLAISTVFLFSIFALLVFRPVAALLGLDSLHAGLWSGLAVNDFSSAVAVGKLMNGLGGALPGEEIGSAAAAAAKSSRILLLAPLMITLALLRQGREVVKGVGKSARQHLPKFAFGYLALVVVRGVGDHHFRGAAAWQGILRADEFAVSLLIVTVAAGIGLNMEVRNLLVAGVRSLVAGGAGSLWMASVALAMVSLVSRGAHSSAALVAAGALGASFAAYRAAMRGDAPLRALRARFDNGAPLSLAETVRLLDSWEREETPFEPHLQKLVRQLHPSLDELIPVRESPLPHGRGARWVTYWQGKTGWALVAFSYEPGSVTPIHAHPHRLVGKSVEGILEEFRFAERGEGALEVLERRVLHQKDLVECEGLATPHLVRPIHRQGAIDIQFRGPEVGKPGRRFLPAAGLDLEGLQAPSRVAVTSEVDDRPGQGGEGAAAGRLETGLPKLPTLN